MDRLDERCPQLRLSADQIARPAADAPVEAGTDAESLVLGSRALSGLGVFMAGSVASAAVAHAIRPVVLVRAEHTPGDERLRNAEGRVSSCTPYRDVVVGIDPTHSYEELLALAFDSALLRDAPLRVVYAWQLPYMPGAAEVKARRAVREAAERTLSWLQVPWREKYPAVEVHEMVEEGRPAHRLVDVARDAGLLVVERRIRPAGFGTHTGPVAHAVIHHVRRPVAVVPRE